LDWRVDTQKKDVCKEIEGINSDKEWTTTIAPDKVGVGRTTNAI